MTYALPHIIVRPITTWIGPETVNRRRAKFRKPHSYIMELLKRELFLLDCTARAIVEIDVGLWDVRQDGQLRSNARPQGPRVIVSADTYLGPMRWPCDTFTDHTDNVYAIALTLEKLRAIDRYGVTAHGEQYAGWTAIPSKTNDTREVDAAWAVLAVVSGHAVQDRTRAVLDLVFRLAARNAHPDRGGTHETMSEVNAARDTILPSLGK